MSKKMVKDGRQFTLLNIAYGKTRMIYVHFRVFRVFGFPSHAFFFSLIP